MVEISPNYINVQFIERFEALDVCMAGLRTTLFRQILGCAQTFVSNVHNLTKEGEITPSRQYS